MKANPILAEVRQTKDRLAQEAGYDMDRYCGQLRAWSEAHPPVGPVVRNATELHRWEERTRDRTEASPLLVKEDPPGPPA